MEINDIKKEYTKKIKGRFKKIKILFWILL